MLPEKLTPQPLLGPQALGSGGARNGGKTSQPPAGRKKFCLWSTCTAAKAGRPTVGGKLECHSCGKHFSQAPPAEKVIDWAWKQQLAAERAKAAPEAQPGQTTQGQKGKGKGKGKDSGDSTKGSGKGKQSTSEVGLEATRVQRLAELKAAKAGTTPTPTATDKVAEVFNNGKEVVWDGNRVEQAAAEKVALDEEVVEQSTLLSEHAKEVVDSMHGEHYPTKRALPTADETLALLLSSVESCASLEAKAAADRALQATTQAVACFTSADTPANDAVLVSLLKKKELQQREVTRLTDKAPSDKLRRQALSEAKGRYQRGLQAEEDFCEKGKQKAAQRARERRLNLDRLAKLLAVLQATTEKEAENLAELHEARTTRKMDLGVEVHELLDGMIKDLDDKMAVDLGSDEEFEDSLETTTETEDQLAAARAEVAKNQALSVAELERLQKETYRDAAVLKAEAERDLARNETDAARKETSSVEARIAKLEALLSGMSGAQAPAAVVEPVVVSAVLADLHREFNAQQSLLPPLEGTPSQEQATTLKNLVALFAAVPWGTQMPAVSFHVLGAPPHFVHSLVGDAMWMDCWKDQHSTITDAVMVPFKMMAVLKHVVESYQTQEAYATNVDAGTEIYGKVMEAARERKALGSPY